MLPPLCMLFRVDPRSLCIHLPSKAAKPLYEQLEEEKQKRQDEYDQVTKLIFGNTPPPTNAVVMTVCVNGSVCVWICMTLNSAQRHRKRWMRRTSLSSMTSTRGRSTRRWVTRKTHIPLHHASPFSSFITYLSSFITVHLSSFINCITPIHSAHLSHSKHPAFSVTHSSSFSLLCDGQEMIHQQEEHELDGFSTYSIPPLLMLLLFVFINPSPTIGLPCPISTITHLAGPTHYNCPQKPLVFHEPFTLPRTLKLPHTQLHPHPLASDR